MLIKLLEAAEDHINLNKQAFLNNNDPFLKDAIKTEVKRLNILLLEIQAIKNDLINDRPVTLSGELKTELLRVPGSVYKPILETFGYKANSINWCYSWLYELDLQTA